MIRVESAPTGIDVTPGHPVDLVLTVANDGAAPSTLTLRLVGLDPGWIAWPAALPVADGAAGPVLSLDGGESIEIPIRITLPPGFPAGAQLIGIEAAIDGVTRPALGSMQLSVADIDGVSLGMSPASFRGGRSGRFRLNIVNRGKAPIALALSGRPAGDDEASLKFRFKPNELTLRPDERVRVRGRVTGKRPIIGKPRIRPMTIVAQSNSAPLHADARFTQRPLLSRRVLRVFGIFVALSMWAGALVSAVRWSGDRREETAAEASVEGDETTTTPIEMGDPVEVDTDGDGVPDTTMVDTDGDGVPDTELVDTDGDGVPDSPAPPGGEGLPGGPVLSGQVTGVADRSNITVTGRYVELASPLPTGGGGVTAQGIDDGRKGKLFAAGARTVDTDDPAKKERSTVTDEQGFWKLAGVAEGNWELTFAKVGFATRTIVVPVEDGVELDPIEVAMAAGSGSIGGTASTAGGPLGGAVVTVTDGKLVFTTTTPTEGNVGEWQLGGLSTPGTYLVSVAKRGFGTQTASVHLGPSGSDLGVHLQLVAGVGSIEGIVTGADGKGIGGITVTAASPTTTRSVTTLSTDDALPDDPGGTFLLPQLPIPGDYTITITGAGWVPKTQLVQLRGAVKLEPFELESTTRTIVGTVKGPDGPLPAVGVTVSQDEPLVKTLTAENGSYEVSNLQPGTYTVTFELFGYDTTSKIVTLGAKPVETASANMVATTAAAKAGDATVQGIVRSGTTGQPITGVAVAFQGKSATSAEGGTFTLAGLAAGTGDITLTHAQYQATSRTVRLGVKATIQVDITMLPLGGLQGQVTDLTATPISGVSVSVAADAAAGTAAITVPAATTDANGEFSILQSFPTGSYIATFSKAGYGTQTREFAATAGSIATTDIQLVELGTITGALQEPGGGVGGFLSLDGVTVTVEKLVNGVVSGAPVFGPVVKDGSYTVSGLAAGDYRITATKEFTVGVPTTVTRDITDLKLREVRDGGIVMNRGSAAVAGQVYFATGTGRQGVIGATVTARVVTGYTILPTFPFISPQLEDVSTTTVAKDTLVDADDDGAVDDAAPVDGYYVIDPQPVSGSIAVYSVAAAGFGTRIQAITSPTAGGSGDIALIPNPKDISGTIAVNPAVAGAQLVATLTSDVLSAPITHDTVTTGAGGTTSYAFADLSPGSYTVTFTSLDGAGDTDTLPDYHGGTDSVTLTVLSPEANDLGTTTLDRTSSLEIAVDTNASGGAAVSGASVTITALSGTAFTKTITADNDGEALFEDLTARSYRVSVSRTGFETVTSSATAGVTLITDTAVAIGQNASAVVALQRHPDVTITVTGRRTNLAPDGPSDAAIENATVTLTPTGGGTAVNLIHDADGKYAATLVPPGGYTLNISAPAHDSLAPATVTIGAGPNISLARELSRFASLVVFLDKSVGGVTSDFTDADHTATPATITATPTAGGAAITLTKCTSDSALPCSGEVGTWVANNVAAGTYAISASASGFGSDTGAITNVVSGSTFTGTLELSKFATLTVNVTKDPDGGGEQTASATSADSVTATRTDGTVIPMAGTGVLGEYRITSITPGTYNIAVQKTDHVIARVLNVSVTSGASETRTIELFDLPNAVVTVEDGTAAAITDGIVLATPVGGGSPISLLHDSGSPGTYRASKVPTGEYTLSVSAPGFATFTGVSGDFKSVGSTAITAEVVLAVASSIKVTVYDSDEVAGSELDGAMVVLRAVGGTNPTSRVRFTGDDGAGLVEFNEVSPTTELYKYSITVSKAGYATAQETGITLGPGTSLPRTVVLEKLAVIGFSITGTPGGAAVTGATVTATSRTAGDNTQLTAVPLFNGSYVFPGLPAGDWTISYAAPNHGTYPAATSVTLSDQDSTDLGGAADGDVVAGVNRTYALTLPAWPTQTVLVDGGLTTSPADLGGATVTATPTTGGGGAVLLTETATTGTYISPPLTPGLTYTLSASKTGYTLQATKSTGAVVAGTALGDAVLNLLSNPTQSVDVTRVVDGAAAAALSGATVTATRTGGPTYTLIETSTAGQYITPALEPGGAYTISASFGSDVLDATRSTAAVAAGTALSLITGADALVLRAVPTLTVDVVGGFDLPNPANDPTAPGGDGAIVTATPTAGGSAITLAPTGTAGEYRTSNLAAGSTYTVRAAKDGYSLVATASFTATAGAANGEVGLTLLQHPDLQVDALAGLVGGLTPAAANTATFTLTPQAGGAPVVMTKHAMNGSFTYAALPPGAYTLSATLANHTSTAQTVTALAGTVHAGITGFQLLQHPTLTASLTSGAGGDIDDATVTARRTANGDVIALDFTATGVYAAALVPPGQYEITATAPNHNTQTSTVTVDAGEDELANLVLQRFGTLSVTVNSSVDVDGIDDGDPATLTATDGATVTATNVSTGATFNVPQVAGAPAGDYAAADLPAGTYSISASLAGHDSGTAVGGNLAIGTTGSHSATVNLLDWPDLVVDVDSIINDVQAALTGATVTATPTSGGPAITIIESATPGVHSLLGVAPGTYAVAASKTGYVTHSANVTAVAGERLSVVATASTHVERNLARHPTVTVDVDDGENGSSDLSGATVTLTNTSTSAVIAMPETATAGRYAAQLVPPGTYDVRAVADGYIAATVAGVVVGGAGNEGDDVTVPGPIVLHGAAALTVTVNSSLDSGSPGFDGATVSAVSTAGDAFLLEEDPDATVGNYRTRNLPAGTYTVHAAAAGHTAGSAATTPAAIDADTDGTATVTLLRHPTLTVEVEGTAGGATSPLAGATVTASPVGGGAVLTLGATTTDGTYTATSITPGVAYLVTATKTGYAADSETTAVVVAGTTPATVELTLVDATTFTVTVRSTTTLGGVTTTADLTTATVTVDLLAGGGTVTLAHQHDGVYSGTVVAAGSYEINVSANGHTSRKDDDGGAGYTVSVGGADVTTTISLAAVDGSVSGTVINLASGPLENVSVSARNGSTTVGPVLTDVDGLYTVTGLVPGVWELTFSFDEMAPLSLIVTVPYGSTVGFGAALTGVNVTLAPEGGAINGQVLEKASSLAASFGNPATGIGGVTVRLRVDGSGDDLRTFTPTEETGFWFGFGGLDAGRYDLVFDIADATYTDGAINDVDVAGGEIVTRTHTFVAPIRTLNVSTVLASDGSNVNGVVVTLDNPALDEDGTDLTATSAAGLAAFTVPYGTWTLTITTTPAGYVSVEDSSRTIVVNNSSTATNITHRFSAVGTISGTVSANDDSPAASASFNDGPVAGATAVATHVNGYRQEATVGADGTYTLANVPVDDDYVVTISHVDYVDFVDADVDVTVDTSLATTAGDVDVDGSMHKLASFTIDVVDQTPAPLPGAAISLFQNVDGTGAVTAYRGGTGIGSGTTSFQVSGLDPTAADVELHVRGSLAGYFQVVDTTVTLVAGDNGAKTLELVQDADLTISTAGLTGGDDLSVTFTWTRLGVVATSGPHAFDNSNDPIEVNGLPAELSITATTVEAGTTCTISVGPGGVGVATFSLVAGSTNTLTYTCT